MHASEQVVDLRTCSILLDGLCKRGELGEVLKVFEAMRNSGLNLDTNSYSIIIDGFCKAGHIEAAKKLFLELSVNGLKPNVYTYAIMIDGFCNEGLSEEAYQLFRSMGDNDCSPDSRCYNVMIQGFLRNNCISNAIQLLVEMVTLIGISTFIVIAVSCQAELVFSTNDNTAGESSTLHCKSLKKGQSFTYRMLKQLAGLKSQSVLLSWLSLFNAKGASQNSSLGSHRDSSARAGDYSQDGRQHKQFSEQNDGVPPSYEEAVRESRILSIVKTKCSGIDLLGAQVDSWAIAPTIPETPASEVDAHGKSGAIPTFAAANQSASITIEIRVLHE
ncbi:hypothetical protein V6N13_133485 [Hibiscus sabdariffa]